MQGTVRKYANTIKSRELPVDDDVIDELDKSIMYGRAAFVRDIQKV